MRLEQLGLGRCASWRYFLAGEGLVIIVAKIKRNIKVTEASVLVMAEYSMTQGLGHSILIMIGTGSQTDRPGNLDKREL
eukprot:1159485-Pelagomonas_calceolata.AAC.6